LPAVQRLAPERETVRLRKRLAELAFFEALMEGVTCRDGRIRRRTCDVRWYGAQGYKQRRAATVLK
jgi:hypothetical protein